MRLSINRAVLIFAFLSVIGTLLAAFFLAGTGIGTNDLLSFSISEKIPKLASQSFFLLVIFLPFVAGLISAAPDHLTRTQAWLAIPGGNIIGMVIAVIAFSSLAAFLLPGLFFLIGAMLSIQLVYMKKEELKNWIGIRLANASTQRQATVIALGLILWSAATLLPQQETVAKNFEKTLMETALAGNGETSLNETLTSQVGELLVENQRQTIRQIVQLPQFQALQNSGNAEETAFVQAMMQLQETVLSQEYKNEIKQRVQQSANQNKISGEQLIAQVKQQMPALDTFEKWLWLILSFGIASLFLLLALVLRPIGILWGFLFQKTLPAVLNEIKSGEPEPPSAPPIQKPIPFRPASASTDKISSALRN